MKKPKNNDLLVFLVFFVVVFFYWYLVSMGEEHETKFNFDIVLKHLPSDVIVTEVPTEKLTLVVRDKGERILSYRTRRTFRQLAVDCRNYRAVNGHVIITGPALEELLGGILSSSAQIQSVVPDTIQYYVSPAAGRRLPIRLTGSISADASHVIGSQRLSPDSITVHAPHNVLDTMNCVYTEPVALVGLTDSVTTDVALMLPQRGMLYEPETARLSVQVTPFVEKSFELPVKGWLLPRDGVMVKTFPSKASVRFQVSLEQFYDITPEQFMLAVDYTELGANDGGKARLHLIEKPDDIRSITISPAEVDYVIEINETP